MNAFVNIVYKSFFRRNFIMFFLCIMHPFISPISIKLFSYMGKSVCFKLLIYIYNFLFLHKLNSCCVWEVLTYIERACPAKCELLNKESIFPINKLLTEVMYERSKKLIKMAIFIQIKTYKFNLKWLQ